MHSVLSVCPYFIYLLNKKHSSYIWTELNASKQKQNKNHKSGGSDGRNGVSLQLECFDKTAYDFSSREKQKVTKWGTGPGLVGFWAGKYSVDEARDFKFWM